MRIVFMGTPDFAVPSLNALLERGHEILAVYTQPDKPKNRGHKLAFSPVKEYALTQDLPAAACAEHPAARVHQRARLFAAEVPRRRADPVGGAERR